MKTATAEQSQDSSSEVLVLETLLPAKVFTQGGNEAMEAIKMVLIACEDDDSMSKAIAIASGKIPHCRISY